MMRRHTERHRSDRAGWLRASVLGANDGLVSTASLMLGVAAAAPAGGVESAVLVGGLAGLVAGAMSMAAGEYVSVQSQADTEGADLARERAELAAEPEAELRELTGIYVQRGLSPELAQQVAAQLTKHDALGAHARDELGLSETLAARPLQASAASAASFAAGAALPLAVAALLPLPSAGALVGAIGACTIVGLAALGATAAWAGGAAPLRGALRVTVWGVAAMAATWAAGALFGAAV
jgi:VIT1/CCC1 family predicted Fe2+/Mn2+ transporter